MAKLFLGDSLRTAAERVPLLQYPFWAIEAGVLVAFWGISALLPLDWASALGRRLLRALGPHLPKHQQVQNNLMLAFPDKPAAEIKTLAGEIWGNFGAVLAEFAHLRNLRGDQFRQRIEVVSQVDLQPLCQGRPAVFVAAHLGNWELVPLAATVEFGFPVTVIYAPLQNPLVDRLVVRKRQQLGCAFLAKTAGMRPLFRLLAQGQSLGFVMDQRVDNGEPIPFFGRDSYTTCGPARLALKFGCPLIPAQVERLHGAHFRVTFHAPIQPDDLTADEHSQSIQMTRQINAAFEAWIRQRPQQWLCAKRRWPKERPAAVRAGSAGTDGA